MQQFCAVPQLVEKEKDKKRPAEENGGPETKRKADEYSQMSYYDRNGQSAYGAQAYGQQQWGQQVRSSWHVRALSLDF